MESELQLVPKDLSYAGLLCNGWKRVLRIGADRSLALVSLLWKIESLQRVLSSGDLLDLPGGQRFCVLFLNSFLQDLGEASLLSKLHNFALTRMFLHIPKLFSAYFRGLRVLSVCIS